MSKCASCKKLIEELDSRWVRFKNWLLFRLFGEDVSDIRQGMYTQGFSEGWKAGFEARSTIEERTRKIAADSQARFKQLNNEFIPGTVDKS